MGAVELVSLIVETINTCRVPLDVLDFYAELGVSKGCKLF
jgi:hypothetical protein